MRILRAPYRDTSWPQLLGPESRVLTDGSSPCVGPSVSRLVSLLPWRLLSVAVVGDRGDDPGAAA
jgi:hypothetical protein